MPSAAAAWTEDWEEGLAKDATTGRFLAKKGRTCLRCLSHGLRCTLAFSGMETNPQCTACKRAGVGAARCVRPALADINETKSLGEQRRLFEAVPASGRVPPPPPPEPEEAVAAAVVAAALAGAPSPVDLRTYKFKAEPAGTTSWPDAVAQHHAERPRILYVNGMPVDPRDVKAMALPSFRDAALANADACADADADADAGAADDEDVDVDVGVGADAAAAADPQSVPVPVPVLSDAPWRTASWKDYLPVPQNRSLVGEVGEDVVSEVQWQRDDGGLDAAEEENRGEGDHGKGRGKGKGKSEGMSEEVKFDDDRTKFLQRIRRYPPRAMHLNEMLGETY